MAEIETRPLPPALPKRPDRTTSEKRSDAAAPSRKPDPRPTRVAWGAGAVAALSVMAVGLGRPATTANTVDPAPATTTDASAAHAAVEVRHVIRYVHLKPGQSAPAGAKVITPDAPAPRVVVNRVAAQQPPVQHRVIVTRQSGRP